MTLNRGEGTTAASVNLDGAALGFKVTGDAAWDSDSDDWAMFTPAGNAAVGAMVKTARLKTRSEDEAAVTAWLAAERDRIHAEHKEVRDTMVRETVAYALDEAWESAYGHRFGSHRPHQEDPEEGKR